MIEVLKQAIDYIENVPDDRDGVGHIDRHALVAALKERLAQPEQEPVAWLLTDKNINSLQVDSIQRLIDRLKHAHHTDLCVRINGQDEWFQADWLKHMVRATPPQRTWVDLSDAQIERVYFDVVKEHRGAPMPWGQVQFGRALLNKFKEVNT